MQFEIETSHALPTPDEIFALLPELLAATKELTPRDPSRPLLVLDTLTPAWSNVDFEPNLAALPLRDRAFVERQIERTHREDQLTQTHPWPWVITRLAGATLTDFTLFDEVEPWECLTLEVPVLTIDRARAVVRGQRQQPTYAEDFEHWLVNEGERWILRR